LVDSVEGMVMHGLAKPKFNSLLNFTSLMLIANENIVHSNHPRNQIRGRTQNFPELLKKNM